MSETKSRQTLGIFIVLLVGVLWGGTGVAGEYLINQRGIGSSWLTSFRTSFAGLIMILVLLIGQKGKIGQVWKNKRDAVQMLIFGLFGVGINLYFYMLAVEYTNAPTATTLQYLSPSMIVIYMALRNRCLPSRREVLALLCALAGVFAIATHGNLTRLAITPLGLVIGLFSAFFLAFYAVFPKELLKKYGPVYTFAWGQLVAGVLMNVILCPVWAFTPPANGLVDLPLLLVLGYQLLLGTVLSYCLYLYGVTLIGPARASMLSSIEPGATAVMAAFLLATPLVFMDYVGAVLITLCVLLLAK